jgi:hypothetical protein
MYTMQRVPFCVVGNGTYITSTPRICIRQPRPANIFTLLHEFETPDSKLPDDLYREAETAHARTNDQNFGIERHLGVIDCIPSSRQ